MTSKVRDVNDTKVAPRTPKSPKSQVQEKSQPKPVKSDNYSSDGVTDNDILLLPARDYMILAALTCVALTVRLFRIYQPTSVVFDEVQ